MFLRSCFCFRLLPALVHAQTAPTEALVAARLIQPRQGLGHFLGKLKAGEPVKIAYLGGSITAAPGWRIKTREWLASQYPQAKIEEIHAAIGGTGSDLGVYRVDRDALQHDPDLLFVEFAVNDGGADPKQIHRAMEGIVRKTWHRNPDIDICFVYTFRVGYEKELNEGKCPRAASAMERLADHYGIPSVNVALQVVDLQRQGKLVYQADAPTEAGVIRFSTDGVHPLDEGHSIYADVLAGAIRDMESMGPADHALKLETPFVTDHWQQAQMVPLRSSMLEGDWHELPNDQSLGKSFGARLGTIWEANTPGSKIRIRFRGSSLKLYDLVGPDGGQVTITVDGATRPKPVPRFDSYCTYHRLATLTVADNLDPQQEHTVMIELHPDQPDRSSVAFRLKDPESELKATKYQGTKIWVGQILVLGELTESP